MAAASRGQIVIASVALVALCAAAIVFGLAQWRREPAVGATAAAPSMAPPSPGDRDKGAAALASAKAQADAVANALTASSRGPDGDASLPAFDVARIERSGEAVIAGRAAPGATVELLRNGEHQDQVVADPSGQFVMVPTSPLPPGDYELTLRATTPDGKQATSKQTVVVALQAGAQDKPVVALMAPDKPSVVLSRPAAPNPIGGSIAVETVETGPGGKLFVSGHAAPGAAVRLYLNDSFLAAATAAADGRLAFTVDGGVKPGNYRVRLDEVAAGSGTVRSRAEVPFTAPETVAAGGAASQQPSSQSSSQPALLTARQDGAVVPQPETTAAIGGADAGPRSTVVVPRIATSMVARGDSLWRISRATYGEGTRYAVIYKANRDQIRNPDRIYPGQIFVLPTKVH